MDFFININGITQQLWLDVMGTNPSYFTGNLQRPVEMVSWDSCQSFITKLNQLTGLAYRLPTEAEWEYAARGGNNKDTYIYSGSDNVDAAAWYFGNSNYSTHAVGTKQANQLVLFDMSGNVREWCSDWFGNYSSSTVTNPSGPSSGLLRIDRGGSWGISKHWVQISDRSFHSPSESSRFFGFRLAQ
ncbi:MAG: SUMF1/EgtB/PvdO family nonheme iron enzyme [Sediminibacterium sp.]|nr:SUMF1/EgtB/PvdO family nonheme iron enzyme [Sediminibacterium sp.]